MNKIMKSMVLVAVVIGWAATANAEIRELTKLELGEPVVITRVICADGLKFLLVTGSGVHVNRFDPTYRGAEEMAWSNSGLAEGIAITQMIGPTGHPATCK